MSIIREHTLEDDVYTLADRAHATISKDKPDFEADNLVCNQQEDEATHLISVDLPRCHLLEKLCN
jgi:hypothetical protein